MNKVILICGEPGTGKTTLMRRYITQYNDWVDMEPMKTLSCMYSKSINTYILGKYPEGEVFAGTDRLSMSVQPVATEFVANTEADFLIEGDRLFNRKFIDAVLKMKNKKLSILALNVDRDTLKERYELRGSNQNEEFLRSRATKVSNITNAFDLMDVVHSFTHMNESDSIGLIQWINQTLRVE
jgi:adenylate kinase family enzyme